MNTEADIAESCDLRIGDITDDFPTCLLDWEGDGDGVRVWSFNVPSSSAVARLTLLYFGITFSRKAKRRRVYLRRGGKLDG